MWEVRSSKVYGFILTDNGRVVCDGEDFEKIGLDTIKKLASILNEKDNEIQALKEQCYNGPI